jgi:predicted Fe-Mo cluster-binding NifX family protein
LRDEPAFARGLEDGSLVAFEVGLRPPQRGHARIQPRELLFDFGDDAVLFGEWGKGQYNLLQLRGVDIRDRNSKTFLGNGIPI